MTKGEIKQQIENEYYNCIHDELLPDGHKEDMEIFKERLTEILFNAISSAREEGRSQMRIAAKKAVVDLILSSINPCKPDLRATDVLMAIDNIEISAQ